MVCPPEPLGSFSLLGLKLGHQLDQLGASAPPRVSDSGRVSNTSQGLLVWGPPPEDH